MQTGFSLPSSGIGTVLRKSDSSKLVSLLALAAGAATMPQDSRADIIYHSLTDNPVQVGFAGGFTDTYMFPDLPGTVQFGFKRSVVTGQTPAYSLTYQRRYVSAGAFGPVVGGVKGLNGGFAAPLNAGDAWNQPLATFYSVFMGVASTYGHSPTSGYDHKYLAFLFRDTSQGGSPFRFGWIEVSLSIANIGGLGTGPNVTIFGYAFDNTGLRPAMGVGVPEPSSAALLALGALALGARGVRSWRRNRVPADKS